MRSRTDSAANHQSPVVGGNQCRASRPAPSGTRSSSGGPARSS
nr:MAG TPA: hypothetical protein [Caudoviricetes sp.]